mmetsp:Transcript_20515/g.68654  ORF Transcript_20515/g.68654 Transcript_20515/m.68654 type:complete len:209 (+) Transcript_20515:977-1603(+)
MWCRKCLGTWRKLDSSTTPWSKRSRTASCPGSLAGSRQASTEQERLMRSSSKPLSGPSSCRRPRTNLSLTSTTSSRRKQTRLQKKRRKRSSRRSRRPMREREREKERERCKQKESNLQKELRRRHRHSFSLLVHVGDGKLSETVLYLKEFVGPQPPPPLEGDRRSEEAIGRVIVKGDSHDFLNEMSNIALTQVSALHSQCLRRMCVKL